MKSIASIYLVWRKGKGSSRKIVGIIKNNATKGVRFSYLSEGVSEAMKEGFTPYVDFPDITKEYSENVLDIFGQRLIKAERTDSQKYLDFWDIEPEFKDDKYYLLAYTQGMLTNDNFEFLADFHPKKDLCFVSEICGLSHFKTELGFLKAGDILTWKSDPNNVKDKFAVKVYKDDKFIGFVKLIHSRIFYKKDNVSLKISIKSIDQNGALNRVFIEISY